MANRVKPKALIKSKSPHADFDAVLGMIDAARTRAVAAVNTALIDLYWSIGEHISRRIADAGWGKSTVEDLADYIQRRQPGVGGYSAQNLWRMRQFYDLYHDQPILSPLVRELSWTHNLLIMGKCKRNEEREFYLRLCSRELWGKRELERQIAGCLFERSILSPPKLSPLVTEFYGDALDIFKDSYLLEFLNLPTGHSEADLHTALIEQLKRFIIELGRDFCFVGSKYRVQVGGRDFEIDLVFFNRALNAGGHRIEDRRISANTSASSNSIWKRSIASKGSRTRTRPSASFCATSKTTKSSNTPFAVLCRRHWWLNIKQAARQKLLAAKLTNSI